MHSLRDYGATQRQQTGSEISTAPSTSASVRTITLQPETTKLNEYMSFSKSWSMKGRHWLMLSLVVMVSTVLALVIFIPIKGANSDSDRKLIIIGKSPARVEQKDNFLLSAQRPSETGIKEHSRPELPQIRPALPEVKPAPRDHAIKLLEEVPLVDGHNDLAWNIRTFVDNKLQNVNLDQDLRKVEPWSRSPWSHTDIPRLRQGRVGAQFWSVYVPCEAQYLNSVDLTLQQMDVVKRMTAMYPHHFHYATSVADIEKAHKENKIASLMGVEGGHSIGNSLAILRSFYELGVRYLTLTHSCNIPWADSYIATRDSSQVHHGLSDFGKDVVREMNRLGMLVDLAHVSFDTMHDALDTTIAPVIFSHTSVYSVCNNSRNVPDDVLIRVKENEGIVMINFFTPYISCNGIATLSHVADHMDYIKRMIGIDYVGIGSDFDGINRLPRGLEDVSKYPDLFAELIIRGWSDLDVKKAAGLNFLRVFKRVEEIRDRFKNVPPLESLIPQEVLHGLTNCTYEFRSLQ